MAQHRTTNANENISLKNQARNRQKAHGHAALQMKLRICLPKLNICANTLYSTASDCLTKPIHVNLRPHACHLGRPTLTGRTASWHKTIEPMNQTSVGLAAQTMRMPRQTFLNEMRQAMVGSDLAAKQVTQNMCESKAGRLQRPAKSLPGIHSRQQWPTPNAWPQERAMRERPTLLDFAAQKGTGRAPAYESAFLCFRHLFERSWLQKPNTYPKQ